MFDISIDKARTMLCLKLEGFLTPEHLQIFTDKKESALRELGYPMAGISALLI